MIMPRFFSSKTNLHSAKRQASIYYNSDRFFNNVLDKFEYVTDSGSYFFARINKITPDGTKQFGKWR
jgi:hypothetical protein